MLAYTTKTTTIGLTVSGGGGNAFKFGGRKFESPLLTAAR